MIRAPALLDIHNRHRLQVRWWGCRLRQLRWPRNAVFWTHLMGRAYLPVAKTNTKICGMRASVKYANSGVIVWIIFGPRNMQM